MTDTQIDDPENYPTFFVRFAMNIKAPTPGDAVAGMVEQFTEFGLRKWTFRVDQLPTVEGEDPKIIGYFDGHGEPKVDDDESEDTDEPVDGDDSSEPAATVVPNGDSDDELVEYAESLTQ